MFNTILQYVCNLAFLWLVAIIAWALALLAMIFYSEWAGWAPSARTCRVMDYIGDLLLFNLKRNRHEHDD